MYFLSDFAEFGRKQEQEREKRNNTVKVALAVGGGAGIGAALSEDYVNNSYKPLEKRVQRFGNSYKRRVDKINNYINNNDLDGMAKSGNIALRHGKKYTSAVNKLNKANNRMKLAKNLSIPVGALGGAGLAYGGYRLGKMLTKKSKENKK
jgi:hypothetical protein